MQEAEDATWTTIVLRDRIAASPFLIIDFIGTETLGVVFSKTDLGDAPAHIFNWLLLRNNTYCDSCYKDRKNH